MRIRIFDYIDGKLILNDIVERIPWLRAVKENYPDDPIPAFSYIDFMTAPDSAYTNLAEKRIERILEDVGGDFDTEDPVIEEAISKLMDHYETPLTQLYDGSKNTAQVMGKYLKGLTENSIEYGKDGNLDSIFRMLKEIGKVAESYLKVEKLWTEQVQQKLRGNAELGEY